MFAQTHRMRHRVLRTREIVSQSISHEKTSWLGPFRGRQEYLRWVAQKFSCWALSQVSGSHSSRAVCRRQSWSNLCPRYGGNLTGGLENGGPIFTRHDGAANEIFDIIFQLMKSYLLHHCLCFGATLAARSAPASMILRPSFFLFLM